MSKVMESHINRQLKYWERQKSAGLADKEEGVTGGGRPFICVTREYGCGGFEIASAVTEILNNEYRAEPVWAAYDRKILEKLSEDMGFSTKLAETLTEKTKGQMVDFFQQLMSDIPSKYDVYRKQSEIVRSLATKGNVIIVGRGATVITKDMKNGLHIKIVAPYKWRIERIAKLFDLKRDDAKRLIIEKETLRQNIFSGVLNYDVMDPYYYNIILNCAKFTTGEAAGIIIAAMKTQGWLY